MNDPEFDEWLGFHISRFTGCASWLGKFPSKPRFIGDPTQKSIVEAWRMTMRHSELARAKEASQALANGDEEFPERGYDCHPRTVRAIAARLAGKSTSQSVRRYTAGPDGEEVFNCGQCKDMGFVCVWHPLAVRFFQREFSDAPPENWLRWWEDNRWRKTKTEQRLSEAVVVKCTCNAGQKKRIEIPSFNAGRYVLHDGKPENALAATVGEYGLNSEF